MERTEKDDQNRAWAELSVPICSTCIYWGKDDETNWLDLGPARFCNHPSVANAYRLTTILQNSVICFDEGGCTGQLCTMPKFGCINHKSNPKLEHRATS